MSQISTKTIPTESPFYQETGDAYYPYLNFKCLTSDVIDSTLDKDWRNENDLRISSMKASNIRSESFFLSELLLNQYNRLDSTSLANQLVSFIFHSAIRKAKSNISTAPVEKKTLHFLRKYISQTAKFELIENSFDLLNKNEIEDYLAGSPFLVDVLLAGSEKIKDIFGSETKVDLEVVTDPEATTKSIMLFAYINTSLSPVVALEYLDQFDYEWYLEQNNDVLETLIFSIKT